MYTKLLFRRLRSLAIFSCGAYITFCGVCYYTNEPRFYRNILLPMVHKLDPETSHFLAVEVLKNQLVSKPKFKDPPSLRTRLWNIEFENPIGLAAGFDRHGEAVRGLHKIGFGFIEIGSVTPKPQTGNSKTRLFQLPQDCAIINRYEFNSEGHDVVYERLEAVTRDELANRGIIGVNLGKNKDSTDTIEDYIQGVRKFAPIADYLVINVPSPTKQLRLLQRRKEIANVIDKIIQTRNELPIKRKTPILVKIPADLSTEAKMDVGAVLMRPGKPRVDGIIISNSTKSRPGDLKSPLKREDEEALLKKISTDAIRIMYALTKGEIPIIGVGGVSSGVDAYEKIKAGASLVQVYTALVFQGFPVITKIKEELAQLLKKDGYRSVTEAVGTDHWKIAK